MGHVELRNFQTQSLHLIPIEFVVDVCLVELRRHLITAVALMIQFIVKVIVLAFK